MAGHSARAVSGRGVNAATSFTFLFTLGFTRDGAAHIQSGSPHLHQCSRENSSQTPLIYASLVALNPARLTMETNHRVMVLYIIWRLTIACWFCILLFPCIFVIVFFGYFCRKPNISQIMLILFPFDLCYL